MLRRYLLHSTRVSLPDTIFRGRRAVVTALHDWAERKAGGERIHWVEMQFRHVKHELWMAFCRQNWPVSYVCGRAEISEQVLWHLLDDDMDISVAMIARIAYGLHLDLNFDLQDRAEKVAA